jgi:hypothetical protein
MKPLSLLISAASLMLAATFTTPVFAEQDAEEICLSKADEMQISDDKYDDFIQQCIQELAPKSE